MIIKELCEFIIIDEIKENATASELYFLSCLLGNEMLSLPENWPGRIYTSQFIYDVLLKKKPKLHPKFFRVLKDNVPIKFKSKDKVIWVTTFESEEIKNSVIFHFDDSVNKYLYAGVLDEVSNYYRSENFLNCVQKGIDYVYMSTLLCRSNAYIFAEDTVNEIKSISQKHPDSKLIVVIPNFGYEKLLLELIHAYPQNVYPTKSQRYILKKLGHSEYLSDNRLSCKIIISTPGILTEDLETETIKVYITVGDAPILDNEYGVYIRQWSALPSLMDQQVFLELIRPSHIISIEKNDFENSFDLPFNLRAFIKQTSSSVNIQPDALEDENVSIISIDSIPSSIKSATMDVQNSLTNESLPSTKMFVSQKPSTKTPIATMDQGDLKKENDKAICDKENSKLPTTQGVNLTKTRKRVIRQRTEIVFSDSDEDFEIQKIEPKTQR